jgi:signal transduction histidine kinase
MIRSALVRLARRPGLLGALLFLATMGLAAALAWQAARAAASHRAAAEASLTHHATIAAWRFSREGRSWVGYGMGEAGDVLLREASRHEKLPGPEVLRRLLAEKECDCMSAGFSRTVFLVVNEPEPKLVELGEPLSETGRRALLAAAVDAIADTAVRQGPRQWRILPPGEPRLKRSTDVVLLWKVGDLKRGVRGIYGMVVEPAQIERPLKGALGDAQFFPASLIPRRTADSLVRIEVAGPNGEPLFKAGPDTRSFLGTDTLGIAFGNLVVTAAIDPAAARMLINGGLPSSRAPTIVALFALTLAMGGAALLLLRREHRLARLREDFVSGVSHELRTPLTQIRILSELLQSEGFRTEAEKQRATGIIHREALRLTNLVDNVLEFSRLRRPAKVGPPAPVSLAEVAHELAESFAPLLEAQGNRLHVVIEDDLEVPGDRDAISRVLRNLVENAVKYGPPGQTIRLAMTRAEPAGAALVTVDDRGPGIPRDDRARIWQPYYRLDRDRNAPAGGSGLGLSVVADLMRLLGGRAWVEDAPGGNGGARFAAEFPGARDRSDRGP